MAYFSDPSPSGLCVCLICGVPVPYYPTRQENGGPDNLNCRQIHLDWHREYGTMVPIG